MPWPRPRGGDSLIVHSSLRRLGWVDGGARTVVDALCDTVGDGTILMPTFTRYDRAYDPETSPSTVGAITEAFWNRPEAVRSAHPTKSVAAIGPDAESVVANHELRNSIGPGSPIHRLINDRDGQILLLGVDHTTNSALHVAERLANLPYRDQIAETTIRGEDGSTETVEVNQVHCSHGFGVVGSIATRLGLEREGVSAMRPRASSTDGGFSHWSWSYSRSSLGSSSVTFPTANGVRTRGAASLTGSDCIVTSPLHNLGSRPWISV
ncbi:AAC(3) family N-acetyltransferase [Saliphagus sp. GCM10025308]